MQSPIGAQGGSIRSNERHLGAAAPAPIRIQWDYTNANATAIGQLTMDYLTKVLLPATSKVLSHYLGIRYPDPERYGTLEMQIAPTGLFKMLNERCQLEDNMDT